MSFMVLQTKSRNCLKTGKGCSWHLDHRTAVLLLYLPG